MLSYKIIEFNVEQYSHATFELLCQFLFISGMVETISELKREFSKLKCFIVVSEEKVIAAMTFFPGNKDSSFFNENAIYLDMLCVDKKAQKKGVGKNLINFLEGYARFHGKEHVFVASAPEATEFYEKLGYTPPGKQYREHHKKIINKVQTSFFVKPHISTNRFYFGRLGLYHSSSLLEIVELKKKKFRS